MLQCHEIMRDKISMAQRSLVFSQVTLLSSDQQTFEVERRVAEMSKTIAGGLEGMPIGLGTAEHGLDFHIESCLK